MSSLGIVVNSTGFGYTATSASSVAVGTGSKTFTVPIQLAYRAGQTILIYSTGSTAWMLGTVTSYGGTTLVTSITSASGSGTFTDWNLSLSGGATAPFAPSAWAPISTFSSGWSAGSPSPRFQYAADGITARFAGKITGPSGSIIEIASISLGTAPTNACEMLAYDTGNSRPCVLKISYQSFFRSTFIGINATGASTCVVNLDGITLPLT